MTCCKLSSISGDSSADDIIYLYFENGHYDVLTSVEAFFNKSYYCLKCEKSYDHREDHRCDIRCKCCYNSPACPNIKENLIFCSDCHRIFRGQACFNMHKEKQIATNNKKQRIETSVCQRMQVCPFCDQHLRRANTVPHTCGEFECHICKKSVPKKGSYVF